MIDAEGIQRARSEIVRRFAEQCEFGKQIEDLPEDVKACGQYLGTDSTQRGLHGTAAALCVLGGSNDDRALRLVPQIVKYVKERREIEGEIHAHREDRDAVFAKIDRDDLNVIKISELLYALSVIKEAVAKTDDLVRKLADDLLRGRVAGNGWDYFLDQPEATHLLPTVHAVRALAQAGYDVKSQVQYLVASLGGTQLGSETRADINVRVYCLYVLVTSLDLQDGVDRGSLKRTFFTMWRRLERLLHEDFEQTVEYIRRDAHCYVRVPWQLHLLAVAAQLAPWRRFATVAAQDRLTAIVSAASVMPGFWYLHSGDRISARTNGILYEVLGVITRDLQDTSKLRLMRLIDRARSIASWRSVRVGAWVVVVWSIVNWITTGFDLGDLAPEVIGAALLAILALGKRP